LKQFYFMPFVENNGIKIHYVVEGQGPPLVIIHASMGSHAEWHGVHYQKGVVLPFVLEFLKKILKIQCK